MTTSYELVFIVRPDVVSNQVDQLVDKYKTIIKDKKGKLVKSENWGLRTLAYRINKHRRGYYVMLSIQGTGDVINELERQMRISDDVIRFLTIKVDELDEKPSVMMAPKPVRRRPDSGDGERTERGERHDRSERSEAIEA